MSLVASGGGMDGASGSDDDNKRMGEPIDKPVLPLSDEDSSTDTEEETAGKSSAAAGKKQKKKRGLSKHYVGKLKSFGNLTDLVNTKSEEIVKKEHKVNKRRRKEIARMLRKKTDPEAVSDQLMEEPFDSSDDDHKKKRQHKKFKYADQPMAEADEDDDNGKDDKMVDD